MYNILICDDDRDIVSALDIYLTSEGYRTFKAFDGTEVLTLVEREDIHLILMDIMMPGLDGIRTTAKLREKCNIPIILLTAKSEDSDKVLGLNIGADDYITKPFNPIEVIARVKSQLRRYTTLGGRGVQEETSLLRNGGITMDDAAKSVTVDGESVSLTPLSTTSSSCSFPTPAGFSPPDRSTSRCGTTPPWAQRTLWRSISATCGRRLRLTPPIPATSR